MHLIKKLEYKYLLTRYFIQDPVGNMFGWIRYHGIRNVNPTATSFKNISKSHILNNGFSAISKYFNCRHEGGTVITNLKNY